MAFGGLFGAKTPEQGIGQRLDRQHKFHICRKLGRDGFYAYLLENQAQNQKIAIPHFLFDAFRTRVSGLVNQAGEGLEDLSFRNETYFTFHVLKNEHEQILIRQHKDILGAKGELTVERKALPGLKQLLFDKSLQHPNGLLARIVDYHKLFQLTFTEGSESITSNLQLRRDLLWDIVPYYPSRSRLAGEVLKGDEKLENAAAPSTPTKKDKSDNRLFQSRLAERAGDKKYQVDYEILFGDNQRAEEELLAEAADEGRRRAPKNQNYFPLSLTASEIKAFRKLPFRCELSNDDMANLRQGFLADKDCELFLGFEIMDAVFRSHGRLKAARFPLYYTRVTVKESNRHLYLEPPADGRIYLNHLALAQLVTQFGGSDDQEASVRFFETLLNQTIEIDKQLERVSLVRHLPYSEDVFEKTRQILLGYQTENGKGGILGQLKVLGIECDLENVHLYKLPKSQSALAKTLEDDLDQILGSAHDDQEAFYQSLLGRFLTPEADVKVPENTTFKDTPHIPGALPKSTRELMRKLKRHDVVLLEGPPGTGKTFTIMNLFIHSVATGKRLLIVSDQNSAIHALTEKLIQYLLPQDLPAATRKMLEDLWITTLRVVDELPPVEAKLADWARMLRQMLAIEQMKELDYPTPDPEAKAKLTNIDEDIVRIKVAIQQALEVQRGAKAQRHLKVAPKNHHDTTQADIQSLATLVRLVKNNESGMADLVRRFMRMRSAMASSSLKMAYEFFNFTTAEDRREEWQHALKMTQALLTLSPKSQQGFSHVVRDFRDSPIKTYLARKWREEFPEPANFIKRLWRRIKAHPVQDRLEYIAAMLHDQIKLRDLVHEKHESVAYQLALMHDALHPDSSADIPLSLEVCRRLLTGDRQSMQILKPVQELLSQLDVLQTKRDELVRTQFIGGLAGIAKKMFTSQERNNGSNPVTRLSALLDDLKTKTSLDAAKGVIKDLQELLVKTFPIWVCRKQAVPFLFPCEPQSFDLVIVDEATQCRVDDALPLLYRAGKIMVVGDERQTVLAKNSPLDDYLFQAFDLDELLRMSQASGMKGGGSHIFGLVKKIKQAGVMLDEHYRCPPDIIRFSNEYVYHNELKIMQWTMNGSAPSVVVDWSEQKSGDSGKRYNGKFKGIETAMIDRFFDYVADTIKKIEKETGKPVNMETDVALCYFLLKNEPYVKEKKAEFLRNLNRGGDVLDGAGAALQGKERDYIFFLWDINRGNMMAFRQGDLENKRKGELNVLMSRPKRRAYHFLHKNFDTLDHKSATVTDYLWTAYQNQKTTHERKTFVERRSRPPRDLKPWTRASGEVMAELLNLTVSEENLKQDFAVQTGVAVGDPRHRVDLMLVPKSKKAGIRSALGVVDLAGFEMNERTAHDIVDYYFQLKRAQPVISPIFVFLNELVDERTTTVGHIRENLKKLAA